VVINADDDARRAIGAIAEAAGFRAVTARPEEAGGTPRAIQQFLRDHDARVVVYDVAAPLRQSWTTLQDLRYAEMISGSWRQFVITTRDQAALAEEVGPTAAIQVAGDRLDRAEIAQALQRAILV